MTSRVSTWQVGEAPHPSQAGGAGVLKPGLAALRARETERNLYADPRYLSAVYRGAIGPATRKLLVRWVFRAARRARVACHAEVAALAVNYLDRVMAVIRVRMAALQMLASACLHLACKLAHGYNAPELAHHGIVLDPAVELPILQALRWRLVVPTPMSFVPLYAETLCLTDSSVTRVAQRLERLISEYESLKYTPRILTLAALLSLERDKFLTSDGKDVITRSLDRSERRAVRRALGLLN